MNAYERRKYIEEIFKLCSTESILIINKWGMIERRLCPFFVIVVKEVPPLVGGAVVMVTAVRMSMELIDVYIVKNNAYHHYNFVLYFE
jgi:hypothetical protein